MIKHLNQKLLSGSIILIILLSISCSTPYYIVSDFDTKTADQKVIAILPFEVIYTGTMPKDMTQEHLIEIEEAESKAFLISFYNEILRSTKGGKNPIRVDIQNYDKTASILKENNISVKDSWQSDPQKLASMLGVDAVVKAHIEKARFMSDLASYGIEVGADLLNFFTNNKSAEWIPGGITISKEVKASYIIVDKQDGTTLWSIAYDIESDWSQKANTIIDGINSKAAKYFPYREK